LDDKPSIILIRPPSIIVTTLIARRYGVSEASLYRWRDEFLAAGEAALAGGTRNGAGTRDRQIAEFERQIEKRDQVIGELTVANRILKKLSGQSL
jgi:transposase-like protein